MFTQKMQRKFFELPREQTFQLGLIGGAALSVVAMFAMSVHLDRIGSQVSRDMQAERAQAAAEILQTNACTAGGGKVLYVRDLALEVGSWPLQRLIFGIESEQTKLVPLRNADGELACQKA